MGLNPTDPDREDEPASHIGIRFITDRFSSRFQRHMYNTDQCHNERENDLVQDGRKVGGGAEIDTDSDWLEIKSHPGWFEHALSSGEI